MKTYFNLLSALLFFGSFTGVLLGIDTLGMCVLMLAAIYFKQWSKDIDD